MKARIRINDTKWYHLTPKGHVVMKGKYEATVIEAENAHAIVAGWRRRGMWISAKVVEVTE